MVQAFWKLKENVREAHDLEAADAHAARTILHGCLSLWQAHADASRAHKLRMAGAAAAWAFNTQAVAFAMWAEQAREQRHSRDAVGAHPCHTILLC